jgi:hypothetical protein
VGQGLGAQRLDAPAEGGQARPPGGEERSVHIGRIYTASGLTSMVESPP